MHRNRGGGTLDVATIVRRKFDRWDTQGASATWNCARPPMDRTKKISEEVREAQVRQLFVAQHRDPAKRTVTSVLMFYAWLEGHRPELLPQGKNDDPLQYLESDLSGLYQA